MSDPLWGWQTLRSTAPLPGTHAGQGTGDRIVLGMLHTFPAPPKKETERLVWLS